MTDPAPMTCEYDHEPHPGPCIPWAAATGTQTGEQENENDG